MFFSCLVMRNFIIGVRANLSGNHKTIGVTRLAQGPRPPSPNRNASNDKNGGTKSIVSSVSVSFSIFRVQQSRIQQQLAIKLILTTKGHGPCSLNFCEPI